MIKEKILNFFNQQKILMIFIGMFVVLLIISPSFRDYKNLLNIIKKITIMGIISCGLTFVVVGGGLDLSIGSTFSLTGVLAIMFQSKGIIIAILISIGVAGIIGFINGYISTKCNVSSIIVTLGMLSVVLGFDLIITKGITQLGALDSPYGLIYSGSLLGIPNYVSIFFIVAFSLYIVLQKTTFGRFIYLTGSNSESAKIAGIKVDRVRILTFIICSICVAIASILLSARMSSATAYTGQGFEFEAVASVLVGGNSIGGGKGGIYNTILGVLLLAVLINGMILLNLPFALQAVAKGLLILIAVWSGMKSR
jgi:ribose/xylose/arabinose/galactoside ABC-type transport system permease subunit